MHAVHIYLCWSLFVVTCAAGHRGAIKLICYQWKKSTLRSVLRLLTLVSVAFLASIYRKSETNLKSDRKAITKEWRAMPVGTHLPATKDLSGKWWDQNSIPWQQTHDSLSQIMLNVNSEGKNKKGYDIFSKRLFGISDSLRSTKL